MPPPYRGVLFDLFGTLVTFDTARLGALDVGGRRVHTTVAALGPRLAEWVPGVGLEEFWQVLVTVSEEMARARCDDHVELPSRERFRRTLERLGCDDTVLLEAAADLSRRHMSRIVTATLLPPEHTAVLAAVRARGRVGLVSNFDDTATAFVILERHGVLSQLDTVVVSEAIGLRKPHPAVLRTGLRGLELSASEVLFVGDSFADDVGAAVAAGVDVAWIDATASGVPAGAPAPTYMLRQLSDVLRLLERS